MFRLHLYDTNLLALRILFPYFACLTCVFKFFLSVFVGMRMQMSDLLILQAVQYPIKGEADTFIECVPVRACNFCCFIHLICALSDE